MLQEVKMPFRSNVVSTERESVSLCECVSRDKVENPEGTNAD